MKNRNELQFFVILIFASIALSLITMVSLSSLHLGLDFGKDTRIIVQVEDKDAFHSYVRDLQFNHYDARMKVTDEGVFILDISGLESGSEFVKELQNEFKDARVILSGSFGSMTKILNSQSFLVICIFVFGVILGVYYISRFQLAGWYLWLITLFVLFISLLIVMLSGMVFTQMMWHAFLFSFLSLFFVNENMRYYRDNKRIIMSVFSIFLVIGLGFLITDEFYYMAPGLYLLIFGLVAMIFYLLHGFFIDGLFQDYLQDRKFPLDDIFMVENVDNDLVSRILSIILILLVVTSVLTLSRGNSFILNQGQSVDNVLVFDKSTSSTYLEVQARLSKLDLFDNQIDYRVSEQGQTWIEFDESITLEDLEAAAKDINLGLDLSVTYYQTENDNPLLSNAFPSIFLISILIASSLILYLRKSFTTVLAYWVSNVLSFVFFSFLSNLLYLVASSSWLLVGSFTPIIIVLVFLKSMAASDLSFRESYLESLILSLVSFILISLPVLLIVPGSINAEMMLLLLVLMVSAHFALALVAWFFLVRGKYNVQSIH